MAASPSAHARFHLPFRNAEALLDCEAQGAYQNHMASLIERYGIIGDTKTAALVSTRGSIDWLCLPSFDSDACFASLVGYDEHGRWTIQPTAPIRELNQYYDGDTLILVTEFHCDGGAIRLTDFMPPSTETTDIVRLVEGIEGSVPIEMALAPRFGYGINRPWVEQDEDGVSFVTGPDALRLRSDVPVVLRDGSAVAEFTVNRGQRLAFQLCWHASHLPRPQALDAWLELSRTRSYWTDWANRCTYHGRYRGPVVRSLLTLKALTYHPTGAIVAAPTAGLPEELGGVRNWDYRFCWLRDTALTLRALMFAGYVEEASNFRDWLVRAVAGDPVRLQIMYDIRGGRRLTEFELPWLPGYEGSKPVRVGNAASEQLQLDIYGETLNCIYASRKLGLPEHPLGFRVGMAMVQSLQGLWQQPDEGVWEVRGGRRHFTFSKVMAWVAIDRAVRLIEEFGSGGETGLQVVPQLRGLRERIHDEVCERSFNARIGAFTQSYGSDTLDASVLLMTHVGFLPPSDPRVRSTVAAIEKGLLQDGYVLRYAVEHGVDGLAGTEGAFLACSFWLADNYAFTGRHQEAEALFDRLLQLRNHLGLLAEEYDPRLRRQIGNFPQGFSHLALITTAQVLEGTLPIGAHEAAVAPPH
jgi:GH15 family glucan-1,4-alpha-glucosidase